jgi:hypothetical protein
MKRAVIHYRNFSLGLYVAKLEDNTYTVFESHVITEAKPGDILYGKFELTGITTILEHNSQKWIPITIQETGCNESNAIKKANFS